MSRRILNLCVASLLNILCFPVLNSIHWQSCHSSFQSFQMFQFHRLRIKMPYIFLGTFHNRRIILGEVSLKIFHNFTFGFRALFPTGRSASISWKLSATFFQVCQSFDSKVSTWIKKNKFLVKVKASNNVRHSDQECLGDSKMYYTDVLLTVVAENFTFLIWTYCSCTRKAHLGSRRQLRWEVGKWKTTHTVEMRWKKMKNKNGVQ